MRKGFLKKAISAMLALSLVIAMLPATFAAEGEVETDYAGICIEYPTCTVDTKQTTTTFEQADEISGITYDKSSGRLEWLSHTTASAPVWNRCVLSLTVKAGEYCAYKIRVPKAGKYDVTVQYRKGSNGTTGDMYILPINVKDNIATALETATSEISVDFKGSATDAVTDTLHKADTFSWNADKAGEYIVVWKAKGVGSLRPANLIFDGKGNEKAPINAVSEISKTSLNFASGETATIETSSVTMNDLSVGTANDIAVLTYESSNANVVTVSGNLITAVGEGTAKVYTKSGDLILAENEITIIVPEYSGVRAQYPTEPTTYKLSADSTNPGNIKYNISGERVDWYAYTGTKNQKNPKWNMAVACFQFSKAGEYAAYKINIPAKGYYNVSLSYKTNTSGCKADMYIIPGDTDVEDIASKLTPENKYIDGQNFYSATKNDNPEEIEFGYNATEAGEYIVVWAASEVDNSKVSVWCKNLTFDGCVGEDKNGLLGKITLGKDELVVGDSTTATVSLNDAYTGAAVTGAVTYTSSDPEVLSVNGTTITANKPEKATLYAEVEGYGNKVALDVTVTAPAPIELSGDVNFASGADISYKVGDAEAFTEISANDVKSIPIGSEITVKADDADNFAGWVRGTRSSKNWISDESEYTFTIMSHTYLTPIYTETKATDAEQVVEFWNENAEYLGTSDVADGKATAPVATLTGHSFSAWHISEEEILTLESGSVNVSDITDAIIRAVAKHTAVAGFGTKLPNSNASATYWKRGDDIVAYGSTYDFYQWKGAANITYGTDAVENKPLVVLDSTPVDGAYMIEYDKGNASEIVEAGIIYGSDDDIVIGSTDGSKAASQRNGDHGQFCAKPNTESNYDYARGYLIYRGTDNKLYVIYTVAIATE